MGAAAKKQVKEEAPKKKARPELKVVPKVVTKAPAAKKTTATTPSPVTDVSKLTPLQKAQLARKNGTAKPKTKKPLPQFKAPADFKPHFVEVRVRTEADGLLGTQIAATRYIGKYNPEAEDKKKRDMAAYDMVTMIGIQARFAGLTFKPTNDKKFPSVIKGREAVKGAMRLPANTTFKIVLRVNRRMADQTLSVIVKQVHQLQKNDAGRVISKELLREDPVSRMFRRSARYLPAAFKNVQAPPALRRKKDSDVDE